MLLGNLISPQYILGALRPDDHGMSLECDGRYVQNVVVVCVRHEDKVCSSDMRVNGGRVRRRNIIPTIEWPRVSRCSRIRGPAGRLRSKDSRNIWIDQDNCGDRKSTRLNSSHT